MVDLGAGWKSKAFCEVESMGEGCFWLGRILCRRGNGAIREYCTYLSARCWV